MPEKFYRPAIQQQGKKHTKWVALFKPYEVVSVIRTTRIRGESGSFAKEPCVPIGQARTEAKIGSYFETPIVSSSPLALCQRSLETADTLKNVASARNYRTEGD